MINGIIWALQRRKRSKDCAKHRRTVEEVIAKRDAIYTALLASDRKESSAVAKYNVWVEALDWCLGARE